MHRKFYAKFGGGSKRFAKTGDLFLLQPSQSDKASRPEIKKCMQELAKARKELRSKYTSVLF